MDTRNTEHSLSDRIPKRKRQYRDGCPNTTKKSDYIREKKDIPKRVISRKDKRTRILLPTEHRLSNKRKEKMKI